MNITLISKEACRLTILFFIFKMVGVITWDWKWVFAPIWIPVTGVILLVAIAVAIVMLWILSKQIYTICAGDPYDGEYDR